MKYLTSILALVVVSCAVDDTHFVHKQLINWSGEYIVQDGEHTTEYYSNHENFVRPYSSTEYRTDTLVVTALIEVNSCADIVVDIMLSSDTLHLLTKDLRNVACASVNFNKFTYVIHNPENKRFVVMSEPI